MIQNKRGSEKYLSPWNFVVWAVVAIVFLAAISVFNNAKTDVRAEEARLLALRVGDCMIADGKVKQAALDGNFNIFGECSLNKKIIEDSGDYYFKVEFLSLGSKEVVGEVKEIGNGDLAFQCELKNEEEHFAQCYYEKFYVGSDEAGSILINIMAASNNVGEDLK